MSALRLQLKQPTGWFAAGREFAQALTMLSDGAFKLYVHLCLNANRHTGRLSATVDDLARVMTRAPTAIAMNLDELEACAVCRVIRNGGSQLVLEIRDRFWPYEKQQTPGCVPEPEVEFVQKVRDMFLATSLCPGQLLGGRRKDRDRPSSTRSFPRADLTSHPPRMCAQICLHAQRRGPVADHQPRNTSPTSSTKCVRHRYRKATGNRFAQRSHAWRNSGYWRKLLCHDAATCGAVVGCPTAPEHLPTSAE